jgi:hypothetical protein
MKCSVFITLALALAVAARPARRAGRGGRRGGKGGAAASSSAVVAAASASAGAVVAAANATVAAAATDTAAAAAGTAAAAATDTAAAAASTAAAAAAPANTVTSATPDNPDLQNSLTLDPSVIASGFLNDGQDVPAAGQVASLTSGNNFINFCATVPNLPITNGKQITTGSCNPAPMGILPSTDNMPSAKFTFPTNGATIATGKAFTISLAVANFETGHFVNAQANYFAAPQQLNGAGQIVGHSHVVVETLSALDQTTPTDPKKFAFFKGLNAAAVGGILTADVTAGLPVGVYKVSTINTAANHQPVLVPIAQHGSVDDVVYFTVNADGVAAAAAPPAAAASSAAGAAATDAAAAAAAPPAASAAASSAAAAATGAAAAAAGAGAGAASASAAAATVSVAQGANNVAPTPIAKQGKRAL